MTKDVFDQDTHGVDGFFEFMEERQAIYVRRQNGMEPPWTKDPILNTYFFTNVYREQDKVTVWLRENWRDHAHGAHSLIFNMGVARFFNWIPTLKLIGLTNQWTTPRRERTEKLLLAHQKAGNKIFSDAYVIAGTDLKGVNKIHGVLNRLDNLYASAGYIANKLKQDQRLEYAWELLQECPGIGPFISYEIVTDLRHTFVLGDAPDIMTWANPGPGAVRGIQRIYGVALTRSSCLPLMRELLNRAPEYTKLQLEMRDIEHTLCEYDKYLRAKNQQGVVRRYRRAA